MRSLSIHPLKISGNLVCRPRGYLSSLSACGDATHMTIESRECSAVFAVSYPFSFLSMYRQVAVWGGRESQSLSRLAFARNKKKKSNRASAGAGGHAIEPRRNFCKRQRQNMDLSQLGLPEGAGGSVDEIQAKQAAEQQREEQRKSILDQILEPEAAARISRLSLVKKEKARLVEDSLIKAATTGALKSKVTDAQLIAMLEQLNPGEKGIASGGGKKGIVIQRRKYGMDDEDDDDNDDDLS